MFPVLAGRAVHLLAEDPCKIADVLKPAFVGDIADLLIGGGQKTGGLLQAVLLHLKTPKTLLTLALQD